MSASYSVCIHMNAHTRVDKCTQVHKHTHKNSPNKTHSLNKYVKLQINQKYKVFLSSLSSGPCAMFHPLVEQY